MICDDMINEILSFLDPKSVASFFCVNKELASKARDNIVMKERKLLVKELEKTVHKERKYYKSNILHLAIGDRIHDRIHNYSVRYACKKFAILNIVDMYGHVIDDEFIYTILHKFKNTKTSAWATWHKYDDTIIIIKLSYGLLKHECGPEITTINSRYLSYETNKQHLLIPHNIGEPMINMLVTVSHKWNIYEYVILNISENRILLTHLDDIIGIEKELKGKYLDNKWVIDKRKYEIVCFGGFKY